MKHFVTFSALLGAFCLTAPVTGWSKDKHHDHHNHNHGHYDRSHDHRGHYHGPSVYYRSYRPSYYPYYGGYGYGYPYSSYYSRPSFGVSVTTTPTYYSSARYQSVDDDLAVDVQRALARRGYYRGSIDGDVGPGTRSAIREYQYRNRLEVTGRIDRSLLRSLDLD